MNDVINRTEVFDLNGSESATGYLFDRRMVNLNPRTHRIVVDSELYVDEVLQAAHMFQVEISQHLHIEFIEELRDWSTYQLALNVIIVLIVVAGFCINQNPVYRPKYGKPLYPEGQERADSS